MDLIQQLRNIAAFNQLPVNEINRLAQLARRRKLRAGEFLCHQGELWPNAVIISKGKLRWAILAISGREHVLYTLEPGCIFWGHSLFDGQPMPASLSAALSSEIYSWPEEALTPFLKQHPEVLWQIIQDQTQTMRRAREIIYGLAFKPVAGRLAKLLLERSANEPGPTIQRNLTLSEIAAMVASSQEVVCRLLYQFQADGILDINRATITLNDRSALIQLIDSD